MQQFSIRDIENLTGVKAHTMRIWEKRYDFFRAPRKESLHRIYSNDDLRQLLRITYLYHHGWKISKIAALPKETLVQEVLALSQSHNGPEPFINRLLEAALDFNERNFRAGMDHAIKEMGFERCIIEVCYPFLVKLGMLWTSNHLIPAQEHFASYVIQNRLISETEAVGLPDSDNVVMLMCPQGEFHELPLLFINYMLRRRGRPTLFMGTNISLEDLQSFPELQNIKAIYLHLITNFTGSSAEDYLQLLSKRFDRLPIAASGGGIQKVERIPSNVTLLRTDAQIHEWVENIRV